MSQQGVISDSPITPFERLGEVSILSVFNFVTYTGHHTPDKAMHEGFGYAQPKNYQRMDDTIPFFLGGGGLLNIVIINLYKLYGT